MPEREIAADVVQKRVYATHDYSSIAGNLRSGAAGYKYIALLDHTIDAMA